MTLTEPVALGPRRAPSRVMFGHGVNFVQGAIDGVRSKAGEFIATVRDLASGAGGQGIGSSLAAGAIGPAGGTTVHVTVPVTATGTAAGILTSPRYQQDLQAAVQEVTLRHAQLNPTNGLNVAWGRQGS